LFKSSVILVFYNACQNRIDTAIKCMNHKLDRSSS
jgi:hypothetical protein